MGIFIGIGLFALAVHLGSKHALWIPALLVAAAGAAALFGG